MKNLSIEDQAKFDTELNLIVNLTHQNLLNELNVVTIQGQVAFLKSAFIALSQLVEIFDDVKAVEFVGQLASRYIDLITEQDFETLKKEIPELLKIKEKTEDKGIKAIVKSLADRYIRFLANREAELAKGEVINKMLLTTIQNMADATLKLASEMN